MRAGDKVLMNFPAANRDPEAFEDADRVVLDRELNRHVAFGSGIHRCAGSNLARMELRVALEEWLRTDPRVPTGRRAEVTLGRRPGARPTAAAGGVPVRIRVDPGPSARGMPAATAWLPSSSTWTSTDCPQWWVTDGAARTGGPGPTGHRQLSRVRRGRDRRLTPPRGAIARSRSPGRRRYDSRSTIMAMPWPPPTHIDSRPMVLPVSSRALSRVVMMRAPVWPNGWPRAMAPPLTFSLS